MLLLRLDSRHDVRLLLLAQRKSCRLQGDGKVFIGQSLSFFVLDDVVNCSNLLQEKVLFSCGQDLVNSLIQKLDYVTHDRDLLGKFFHLLSNVFRTDFVEHLLRGILFLLIELVGVTARLEHV